jgi:hypothetical protein
MQDQKLAWTSSTGLRTCGARIADTGRIRPQAMLSNAVGSDSADVEAKNLETGSTLDRDGRRKRLHRLVRSLNSRHPRLKPSAEKRAFATLFRGSK